MEESHELKRLKYQPLFEECQDNRWKARCLPVEMGCRDGRGKGETTYGIARESGGEADQLLAGADHPSRHILWRMLWYSAETTKEGGPPPEEGAGQQYNIAVSYNRSIFIQVQPLNIICDCFSFSEHYCMTYHRPLSRCDVLARACK